MNTFFAKEYALPLKYVLKSCNELQIHLNSDKKINLGDSNSLQTYNRCLFKILEGVDLYITKENNLIPTCGLRRLIAEIVVDNINPTKIVEIGTGPYAIMALLFANRGINVVASEINSKSYQSAKNTIKKNQYQHLITIKRSSGGVLSWMKANFPFDCVVSLPPYYDDEDKRDSKAFLGVDSELYSKGKGEDFSLILIDEWILSLDFIKYLVILWKDLSSMNLGINYVNKSYPKINSEKIEIIAGTRKRYLTIFKSK